MACRLKTSRRYWDFCYKFGSSKLLQIYKEVEGGTISYCDVINKIKLAYRVKSHGKADDRLTEFFKVVRKIKEIRVKFGVYHG